MERLSQHLEQQLSKYFHRRVVLWSQLCEHKAFARIFPHLLLQTYMYVKHSCPLMALAADRLPQDSALARYLKQHIVEEADHDNWLLEDLELLGYPRVATTAAFPLRSIAALVGTQMYILTHMSPAGILGYIYVLEAHPVLSKTLKALAARYSLPLGAMSTFLEHSDRDIDHSRTLIEFMDGLALGDAERRIVSYSAVLSCGHICSFLDELILAAETLESPADTSPICGLEKEVHTHPDTL